MKHFEVINNIENINFTNIIDKKGKIRIKKLNYFIIQTNKFNKHTVYGKFFNYYAIISFIILYPIIAFIIFGHNSALQITTALLLLIAYISILRHFRKEYNKGVDDFDELFPYFLWSFGIDNTEKIDLLILALEEKLNANIEDKAFKTKNISKKIRNVTYVIFASILAPVVTEHFENIITYLNSPRHLAIIMYLTLLTICFYILIRIFIKDFSPLTLEYKTKTTISMLYFFKEQNDENFIDNYN